MPTYSGKDAFVTGLANVQTWTVNTTGTSQKHSHSAVPGGTDSPAGIQNHTFSITGVGGQPAYFPTGTNLSSILFTANNTISSKISYSGTILVESLDIVWNRATNAPIAWTMAGGFQGQATKTNTGVADATTKEVENSKDLDIDLGMGITDGFDNVQGCTLSFRRPQSAYVDAGYTYRTAGNLESSLSMQVIESNPTVIAPNTVSEVWIYTTASLYWAIKHFRFLTNTNYQVDRTTNKVIGYTVNAEWAGVQTTTLGSIKGPDATYYYGSA